MFAARQQFNFQSGGGDPFWANVKMLLTARSGTLLDATGYSTISTNAGTGSFVSNTVTNLNPYSFGQLSPNLWQVSPSAERNGTGVFTFEWWYRSYASVATSTFEAPWVPLVTSGDPFSGVGPIGQIGTTNSNRWSINGIGGATYNMTASNVYTETWHHLAWTRDSSNLNTFYFNGVPYGTTITNSATYPFANAIQFGGAGAGPNASSCYWDDFRYTVGIVRYTGAFTPPTTPFPIG
jgi:hypothetical protein